MSIRAIVVFAVAAATLVGLGDTAEARYWRRGWPSYYYGPGYYGWPGWGFPPGGYYGPSNVWYVPPLAPEPAVVLPRKSCAHGRVPSRWVKTQKDGRIVYEHVMSRCR